MQPMNVLRFAKLKHFGNIGAVGAHNYRLRPTPNADPNKQNIIIKGSTDLVADVKEIIGSQKIRKNAVLAVESIISASPEYFRPNEPGRAGHWDEKRLEQWRAAVEPWIEKNFPNAASVVLHLDEATPHYQVVDVPLDKTGKLNARAKYGGPAKMRGWQTSIAKCTAHLGIARGIEGSEAEHTPVSTYYDNVNTESPNVPKVTAKKPKPLPPPTLQEKIPGTDAYKKRQAAEEKYKADTAERAKQIAARNTAAVGAVEQLSDKAANSDLSAKRLKESQATNQKLSAQNTDLKIEADKLRAIPLVDVLTRMYGADEKKDSKAEYKTRNFGLPSGENFGITDDKWFDNAASKGGKGAIDLVMHLEGYKQADYKKALRLLADHFDASAVAAQRTRDLHEQAQKEVAEVKSMPVPLPEPIPSKWARVKRWLTDVRGMPSKLVDWLQAEGLLYADNFANAVFKRSEHAAFLRGTGQQAFKKSVGEKGAGGFVIPGNGDVYLVEGAVDAMAVKAVYASATVIATGGNSVPLKDLMLPAHTERVFAAFDRDRRGQEFSAEAARCFGAERAAPLDAAGTAKDWADAVKQEPALIDPSWAGTDGSGNRSPGMKLG